MVKSLCTAGSDPQHDLCWAWWYRPATPGHRKVEAGRPETHGDPWLHREFEACLGYRRPCLRNKTQCEHRHRGTVKLPRGRAASGLAVCLAGRSYLVDACLSAGKGEGEAQRQLGALEAHIVQEVSDTLYNVVKELQETERERESAALM